MTKHVFITGGSRGIGKETALFFAKKGYDVTISYNSDEVSAQEVVSSINDLGQKGVAIQLDFTAPNIINKSLSKYNIPDISVLVNNAGWTQYIDHKDLDKLDFETFSKVINVNLISHYEVIKFFSPLMRSGHIINVTSIAAYNGVGSNMAYCAAKAAMNSLTKSLSTALAPNITVNGVAPGLTTTEMTNNAPDEYRNQQIDITPLNRLASPIDIAKAVYSFTDGLEFVNGKTIIVDGGRLK